MLFLKVFFFKKSLFSFLSKHHHHTNIGQSEIIQFLEGQVEGNLKEEYQSFANKVGRGKFFASLNSEAGSKKKKTFNEQACNAAVVNISQVNFCC